jgi:hypothetical protein
MIDRMSSSRAFLLVRNLEFRTLLLIGLSILFADDGKIFYCAILQTSLARAPTERAKR